jgi:hypothetical protein
MLWASITCIGGRGSAGLSISRPEGVRFRWFTWVIRRIRRI